MGLPKILIVDDEPRILRSLEAALKYKFDVYKTEDAIQAQNIMEGSKQFDIVVSDERMPKLLGHDFLKWVKDKHPHSVRFLLTSTEISDALEPIGSNDVYKCLSKPWNIQELQEILDQAVLKSRSLVSQAAESQRANSKQCAMAVLDVGETYSKTYQIVGQGFDCISRTYFFDTVEEVIHAMSQNFGIGVLLIDLSVGKTNTADLISELNKKHASVSIIVTNKPAYVGDFIQKYGKSHNFRFITKPMSLTRLRPIILGAVENHFRTLHLFSYIDGI